jgi:hypothetical protein
MALDKTPTIQGFKTLFPDFIGTDLDDEISQLISYNWNSIKDRLGKREDLVIATYFFTMNQWVRTPAGFKFAAHHGLSQNYLEEAYRLLSLAPENGLIF